MIKALLRAAAFVAGSVGLAALLLLCALVAATAIMAIGCASALFGPRKFPWSLLRLP